MFDCGSGMHQPHGDSVLGVSIWQNVNKVNTKVTLKCPVNSPWIPRWAMPVLLKNVGCINAFFSSDQCVHKAFSTSLITPHLHIPF